VPQREHADAPSVILLIEPIVISERHEIGFVKSMSGGADRFERE